MTPKKRLLKFRAWDKKNQRWMTPEIEDSEESGVRLDLWGNVEFRLPWWEQGIIATHRVDGSEMFDIMQSTGLKDINGVEIFEGDYLSWIYPELRNEFKGEVVFSKSSFCIVVGLKGYEYEVLLHELSNSSNLIEVLGNVYEHPRLLEVAK